MADKKKKKPGFVPLSEVVWSALMDIEESEARFEQFLHWAIKGYRELNTEGHFGVRHKELSMTDYKAICLPDDCIDWTVIGIQRGSEIRAFTKNINMPLNFQVLNERNQLDPILNAELSETGYYFYGSYTLKGEDPGQQFGLMLKNNSAGYYREDFDERVIYLRPNEFKTNCRVYIEYISDCSDYNGVIMVHTNAMPVIEAYIHWKDAHFSSNPNKVRMTAIRKEVYDDEYQKYVAKMADWSIEDIEEVLFDSYSLTPKY